MALKRKRQFYVTTAATADQVAEVLKYHYPPGMVSAETKVILSIECDRNSDPINLVDEDIQNLLKKCGIEAKVKFRKQIDLKPEVPEGAKLHYFIDKQNSDRIDGEWRTNVQILTEKQMNSADWDWEEEIAIIDVMLEKANMGVDSQDRDSYWWEMAPTEISGALTKDKGFYRSKTPLVRKGK